MGDAWEDTVNCNGGYSEDNTSYNGSYLENEREDWSELCISQWNEEHVWEWINSKRYGKILEQEPWEFVDGPTLLTLNLESAEALQVPLYLMPRIVKDIKIRLRLEGEQKIAQKKKVQKKLDIQIKKKPQSGKQKILKRKYKDPA